MHMNKGQFSLLLEYFPDLTTQEQGEYAELISTDDLDGTWESSIPRENHLRILEYAVHTKAGILSVRYGNRSMFEGQPTVGIGEAPAFGVIGHEDAIRFLKLFPNTYMVIIEAYAKNEVEAARRLSDYLANRGDFPPYVYALSQDTEQVQALVDSGVLAFGSVPDLLSGIKADREVLGNHPRYSIFKTMSSQCVRENMLQRRSTH